MKKLKKLLIGTKAAGTGIDSRKSEIPGGLIRPAVVLGKGIPEK